MLVSSRSDVLKRSLSDFEINTTSNKYTYTEKIRFQSNRTRKIWSVFDGRNGRITVLFAANDTVE